MAVAAIPAWLKLFGDFYPMIEQAPGRTVPSAAALHRDSCVVSRICGNATIERSIGKTASKSDEKSRNVPSSHHRWNIIDFKALRRWLFLKCCRACCNKPSKKEVCHATLPKSSPSSCWSDPGYFQPYRPRGREIATAH